MKPIHLLLLGFTLALTSPALANDVIDNKIIIKANQGDAVAQFGLGLLHFEGQGVRQNHHTAKAWFGKACDNGDQLGCDNYCELQQMGY